MARALDYARKDQARPSRWGRWNPLRWRWNPLAWPWNPLKWGWRRGDFWPVVPLVGSAILLTLAFAPVYQFYFAWVAMAPWLVVVARCRSQKAAFGWSWVGGSIFFLGNLWWLWFVSVYGMLALSVYCGLYWGFSALIIRGTGLLEMPAEGSPGDDRGIRIASMRSAFIRIALIRIAKIAGIGIVWAGFEWVRGNFLTGIPWLFLGHTQSPFLMVCQVADITGVYGISALVIIVNALLALAWMHRKETHRLIPSTLFVAGITLITITYGFFRLEETPSKLTPGPVVAVIQVSYPQSNSGLKGKPDNERIADHLRLTQEALASSSKPVDLVVWSETMMPALNQGAIAEVDREIVKRYGPGPDSISEFHGIRDLIAALAGDHHVGILTGGEYWADFHDVVRDGETISMPRDSRNSAFFFDRNGHMDDSAGHRYDKVHLVPFGEFIPFKYSLPFLYRIFVALGPKYYDDFELQAGADDALTVFHLPKTATEDQPVATQSADNRSTDSQDWRFVTPICFEDIDSRICARMFRPGEGTEKRADFLINLTNDGWFKANENAQHLQTAIFRSIENRVPTARSVNTGISGFVDSTGHVSGLIDARTEGSSVHQLMLDSRTSFYTRFGDLFALGCLVISAILAAWGWVTARLIRSQN
jgi:apolipoprotein N-acyltransferase